MKDGIFSDDVAPMAKPNFALTASSSGMRHSIRARARNSMVGEIRTTPARQKPQDDPVLKRETLLEQPVVRELADAATARPIEKMQRQTAPAPNPAPTVQRQLGWSDLHKIDAGARKGAGKGIPVVDLARDATSHRAFDLLRTRLRQSTQDNNWVNIGVSAPITGCGTTFTAVNLALSLSRVPSSRTILMDMNLRNPGIMDAFDIKAPGEMQDYLTGNVETQNHIMRISDTLALGLSSAADDNASETLQNPTTAATLNAMQDALEPQLVIYDLPPMLVCDDVTAFMPQLDGVLLVSDGLQTVASQLLECERLLDKQVPLLGVILNRARASSIPQYS